MKKIFAALCALAAALLPFGTAFAQESFPWSEIPVVTEYVPGAAARAVSPEEAARVFKSALSFTDTENMALDVTVYRENGASTKSFKVRSTSAGLHYYYRSGSTEYFYRDGVRFSVKNGDLGDYSVKTMSEKDILDFASPDYALGGCYSIDENEFARAYSIYEENGLYTAVFKNEDIDKLTYRSVIGINAGAHPAWDGYEEYEYDGTPSTLITFSAHGLKRVAYDVRIISYPMSDGKIGGNWYGVGELNVTATGADVNVPFPFSEDLPNGNLSLSATPFADSVYDEGGDTPVAINDNDDNTWWQSERKLMDPEIGNVIAYEDLPYFGLAWDAPVKIGSVSLNWTDVNTQSDSSFDVYFSSGPIELIRRTEPMGTAKEGASWYTDGSAEWKKLELAKDYTVNFMGYMPYSSEGLTEIIFSSPLEAAALKIVVKQGGKKLDLLLVHEITAESADPPDPEETEETVSEINSGVNSETVSKQAVVSWWGPETLPQDNAGDHGNSSGGAFWAVLAAAGVLSAAAGALATVILLRKKK